MRRRFSNSLDAESKNLISRASKITRTILLVFLAAMLVFNSLYFTQEQEKAVVTTFGVPSFVDKAGIHFKVPFIQKVTKVPTYIFGMNIGYDEKEQFIESESLMITSDYNFVNVDFYLEYQVVDPIKALYVSENPSEIVRNLALSYIRDTVGMHTVDEVITTGKGEIQSEIKDKLADRIIDEDIGINIVNITIQDAQPPTNSVINAFMSVETAKQDKEAAINNANQYKSQQIPAARATADGTLREAESFRETRINEAKAQVSMFEAMYNEYKKNPDITLSRMFYEAMEDILPNLKIIIDNGLGTSKVLPLESFVSNTGEDN